MSINALFTPNSLSFTSFITKLFQKLYCCFEVMTDADYCTITIYLQRKEQLLSIKLSSKAAYLNIYIFFTFFYN